MKLLRYFYAVLIILTVMAFTMQVYANPYPPVSDKASKFIKYNFYYHIDNEQNSILQVSLSFRGDSSGKTTLVLPFQIAEVNDLYKNIENLHAVNARIEKTTDPKIYLLHYAPDNIIFIRYQVKQGWLGPLTDPQQSLIPIFQKNYFQFPGEGVLIYPESYKNNNDIYVTFNWQIPNQWMIADSFGTNMTHRTITTNLDSILRGLYIGGDFRLYQNPVKDGIVWTAIQGKWQFKDEEFNNTMVKIVSGGRSFWNDNSPHYLATLLLIGTGCKSAGGTGHTNAFSAFFNAGCALTNNNMLHILSHENFHNWNGPELFDVDDKKREVYYYWFSEGFTDYYASLLNLRSGLLDFENYIKRYNKVLVDYYASPVNTATIEQIAENIWKNFDMERLVYQQGEVLAHNWDTQIKLATKQQSLDDLMRALFYSVKTEKSKLTLDKMGQISEQYQKNDVLQDVNSLYSGKILIPNPNSFGPCVYQTTQMLAPYSRGFDLNTSKEVGKITSVIPDSRAFAAGLRDGQQLIAVEEHPDDISQTMNVTVKDNGLIKIIKYYPYKGELKAIPQFILDQAMWKAETDKCLAWFKAT